MGLARQCHGSICFRRLWPGGDAGWGCQQSCGNHLGLITTNPASTNPYTSMNELSYRFICTILIGCNRRLLRRGTKFKREGRRIKLWLGRREILPRRTEGEDKRMGALAASVSLSRSCQPGIVGLSSVALLFCCPEKIISCFFSLRRVLRGRMLVYCAGS